jgi:AcrR family transcriptional regulator
MDHESAMTPSTHHAHSQGQERKTILDAARTILIQRDYARFSMRGVAAEAGCSPDTVYQHFESEQLLLNCVVDEAFDRLLETLQEIPDTRDPKNSLRRKLRAYVDFGLEFPHQYRIAYIHRPPGKFVTTGGRPHACYDFLRETVRKCFDQNLFVSTDIEMTSQVLWTAIHGVTSALIVMPKFPWVDREQLIDRVIDTAIEGTLETSTQLPPGGGR